ncbi:hypothetical protein IAP91_00010 [Leuconostoc mesenteroides]|nr:hypothetical protein [Leuconostoc mesenteroides]
MVVKVKSNTTMSDVTGRVNYYYKRANEIHKLIADDENEAKRQYTILYKRQKQDYHELSLMHNRTVLESNRALWLYWRFFDHLHFIENTKKNIKWNLSEFRQGKNWFDAELKKMGD